MIPISVLSRFVSFFTCRQSVETVLICTNLSQQGCGKFLMEQWLISESLPFIVKISCVNSLPSKGTIHSSDFSQRMSKIALGQLLSALVRQPFVLIINQCSPSHLLLLSSVTPFHRVLQGHQPPSYIHRFKPLLSHSESCLKEKVLMVTYFFFIEVFLFTVTMDFISPLRFSLGPGDLLCSFLNCSHCYILASGWPLEERLCLCCSLLYHLRSSCLVFLILLQTFPSNLCGGLPWWPCPTNIGQRGQLPVFLLPDWLSGPGFFPY